MRRKAALPPDSDDTPFLIDVSKVECAERGEKHKQIDGAIWTHRKALLIQTYLQLFAFITKRGTYIDAFAGPQDEKGESKTWAAKRVWERNPGARCRRIDKFELFELSPRSHRFLKQMIAATPADGRKVSIVRGDCNLKLPARLATNPVRGPAFCLLDQRSDECDWATVKAIASHKSDPAKIEIFYFVMAGWLDRYRAALGEKSRNVKLLRWWGHEDFSELEKAAPDRAAELFAKRFKKELGYKYADPYPIFDNVAASEKGAVKFFMIHASDHVEAPKLMRRSYRKLATGWNPDVQQEDMGFLEDDLRAMLSGIETWDSRFTEEDLKLRRRRAPKQPRP